MSELLEHVRNCLDDTIWRWSPTMPGAHARVLFLEANLYEQVVNPTDDDARLGGLWAEFDRFSQGGMITVGYKKERNCLFKLLDDRSDQVWEIRSRTPKPQVRIFGRFCGQDQFLATHAVLRDQLGDPDKTKFDGNRWPEEILRCKTIWSTICLGHPPFMGQNIHDYISQNVVEINKLP